MTSREQNFLRASYFYGSAEEVLVVRASKAKFRVMCPYIYCGGKTPGTVWMWGRVTHSYKVKVCRAHEQIYRDYGWIRVRGPAKGARKR